MTQPTERRFVMEPRLDAEVGTLNTAISGKVAKAGDTMTGALTLSGAPTSDLHAATKKYVDDADAALQSQVTSNLQTSRVYVKNGATALTKGTPVYITGADGTNIIIGAAGNGSEATSSKTIGLLETDLAINAMGYVVTDGKLSNIDTSGATAAGDAVWLGPSGTKVYGLANKPVAPAHMVYLGVVSKKNASTGEIQVKVQNGFELDELHNVLINTGTLATGQALTYDASTSLWKNSTPVSSLAGLSDVQLGTLSPNEVLKYNGTKWVNGVAAGGVTAAATAPDISAAKQGDAWFDTNDGTLYVCYIDPDSTKQWVQVQANSALEGSILARLGSLEGQAIAFGALSPNYLINGAFDIWQRGTSNYVVDAYGSADRWKFARGTLAQQTFTPGSQTWATSSYYANFSYTGQTFAYMSQAIEDVRLLAGQNVTISFYAKSSASSSISLRVLQNYGTGGSTPTDAFPTTFSTTTSWQRFTYTYTVPSTSGKTLGPSNTSFTELGFYGTLGTAVTGNFDIANIQLERGNTATSFRRNQPNIQAELAACQRYYWRETVSGTYSVLGTGIVGNSSTNAVVGVTFPVAMRVPPTSAEWTNLHLGDMQAFAHAVTSLNVGSTGASTTRTSLGIACSGGGMTAYRATLLHCEGGSPSYFALSAEL